MNPQSTVGILLAAGSGRRFDPTGERNKLVQLLEDGNSVVQKSARILLDTLPKVVAVVRDKEIAEQLTQLGCQVLMFSGAGQGMGASLAHAVMYVDTQYSDAQSVLIGLADMPYVKPGTVAAVVEQLAQGCGIVQPMYQQQGGHPVGFAREHFPALMALQGDSGARHLLHEFPVTRLPVDDTGVILDIDHLSDLR